MNPFFKGLYSVIIILACISMCWLGYNVWQSNLDAPDRVFTLMLIAYVIIDLFRVMIKE